MARKGIRWTDLLIGFGIGVVAGPAIVVFLMVVNPSQHSLYMARNAIAGAAVALVIAAFVLGYRRARRIYPPRHSN